MQEGLHKVTDVAERSRQIRSWVIKTQLLNDKTKNLKDKSLSFWISETDKETRGMAVKSFRDPGMPRNTLN